MASSHRERDGDGDRVASGRDGGGPDQGHQSDHRRVDQGVECAESSESGSMTVWFAGVVASLVVLTALLIGMLVVWAVKTHVQAVADMSALAGADLSSVAMFEVAPNSRAACEQATMVAASSQVEMRECWVDGGDVKVVVTRPIRVFAWDVAVSARARAGPLEGWSGRPG